jgi:predicted XRE-type DNA-binding protein
VSNKPYHLPRTISTDPEMDVLAWSMPFLMDKIMQMINHIATKNKKFAATEDVSNEEVSDLLKKQVEVFNKR